MNTRESLEAAVATAHKALAAARSALVEQLAAAWTAAGGCAACNGFGRVLTWFTLDGPGYDEFGSCLAGAACTAQRLGPKPGAFAPGSRGGRFQPFEHESLEPLATTLRAAQCAVAEYDEAHRVAKGRTVEVFKGRKVAVGTIGVCIWHGQGNYGWRVGVKDAAGTVHWTAESNVRVAA